MIYTYCELKEKAVINICNGKHLGYISDVEIDVRNGQILRLVLPICGKLFSVFGTKNIVYIPWSCIDRIGDDTILVRFSEIEQR